MTVLAYGVEVAILAVMVGLSWTACFVLFSVRISGFVDIFVHARAWCRLGLRSGSLVPPHRLVGLGGISSVGLSRHRISDFQYFSWLTSFSWIWSIFTLGTRSNSSTRQLTMVSLFVVYGCPVFLLLL